MYKEGPYFRDLHSNFCLPNPTELPEALLILSVPVSELENASRGRALPDIRLPSLSFPFLWDLGDLVVIQYLQTVVFVQFHPVFLIILSRMIGLIQAAYHS